LRIIAVDRRKVITPPPGKPLIKRKSLLRRRADVDAETFEREWRIEHARLVKVDGVVELWFTSADTLNQAFASPQGVQTMACAKSFIDEITTFIVETRIVV
jgi:hypothetical protein